MTPIAASPFALLTDPVTAGAIGPPGSGFGALIGTGAETPQAQAPSAMPATSLPFALGTMAEFLPPTAVAPGDRSVIPLPVARPDQSSGGELPAAWQQQPATAPDALLPPVAPSPRISPVPSPPSARADASPEAAMDISAPFALQASPKPVLTTPAEPQVATLEADVPHADAKPYGAPTASRPPPGGAAPSPALGIPGTLQVPGPVEAAQPSKKILRASAFPVESASQPDVSAQTEEPAPAGSTAVEVDRTSILVSDLPISAAAAVNQAMPAMPIQPRPQAIGPRATLGDADPSATPAPVQSTRKIGFTEQPTPIEPAPTPGITGPALAPDIATAKSTGELPAVPLHTAAPSTLRLGRELTAQPLAAAPTQPSATDASPPPRASTRGETAGRTGKGSKAEARPTADTADGAVQRQALPFPDAPPTADIAKPVTPADRSASNRSLAPPAAPTSGSPPAIAGPAVRTADAEPVTLNDPTPSRSAISAAGGEPRAAPVPTADPALPAFTPAAAPATPSVRSPDPIAVPPTVTARPGLIGHEMGVAIARHVMTNGGDAMTVRLTPADMGRIEVSLSFDASGTLRAVVAADSPAALDMLRRDIADLGRALADAGVRSDGASLRFDTRSDGGGGSGGQFWQRRQDARTGTATRDTDVPTPADPAYRPLRTSGRIDMIA